MFITFDGQHGTGKSYIVDKLYNRLKDDGYSVIKTQEPTDSEIGMLARRAENRYTANILTCLFAADRLQHIEQIKEWLKDGKVVICDRYIISGLILQNMDNVSFNYIMAVNSGILESDLSIVLHADSYLIKERSKGRNTTRLAEQERVEGYDRYKKCSKELGKMFNNIFFFDNNTKEQGERIIKFACEQVMKYDVFQNIKGTESSLNT